MQDKWTIQLVAQSMREASLRDQWLSDSRLPEPTLDWIRYLDVAERKLVWMRADKVAWEKICAEFHCGRTTAQYRWKRALTKICVYLNVQNSRRVQT